MFFKAFSTVSSTTHFTCQLTWLYIFCPQILLKRFFAKTSLWFIYQHLSLGYYCTEPKQVKILICSELYLFISCQNPNFDSSISQASNSLWHSFLKPILYSLNKGKKLVMYKELSIRWIFLMKPRLSIVPVTMN